MRFSMIMRAMKVSWNIHYDFGEKYPSYVKIGMVDLETGEKFYKKSWRYTTKEKFIFSAYFCAISSAAATS